MFETRMLTICILDTLTVKTKMKCRIIWHSIWVCTVCLYKNNLQEKKYHVPPYIAIYASKIVCLIRLLDTFTNSIDNINMEPTSVDTDQTASIAVGSVSTLFAVVF